jgi:hypothetical protein
VIATVDSTAYKGARCLEATRTYTGETGGYLSEVIRRGAQSVGEDKHYAQDPPRLRPGVPRPERRLSAVVPRGSLAPDVAIDDEIRFVGSSGIRGTVGTITALRRHGRFPCLPQRQEDRHHDRHRSTPADLTDRPPIERDLLHGVRGTPSPATRTTTCDTATRAGRGDGSTPVTPEPEHNPTAGAIDPMSHRHSH